MPITQRRKLDYISNQGSKTFHNLMAYIIGQQEIGMDTLKLFMNDPAFRQTELDTGLFQSKLKKGYSLQSDRDLFNHYDEHTLPQ